MFAPTHTLDDRRARVPIVPLREIARHAASAGGESAARVGEFVARCNQGESERYRDKTRTSSIGCLVMVVSFVATMAIIITFRLPDWSRYFTFAIPGLACWYFIYYLDRRPRLERRIATGLNLRVCPACGYDLAGLPVETDSCVICPECRAAWFCTRMALPQDATAVPGNLSSTAPQSASSTHPVRTFFSLRPIQHFRTDAAGRIVRLTDPMLVSLEARLAAGSSTTKSQATLPFAFDHWQALATSFANSSELPTRFESRALHARRSPSSPAERVYRVRTLALRTKAGIAWARAGWLIGLIGLAIGIVGFIYSTRFMGGRMPMLPTPSARTLTDILLNIARYTLFGGAFAMMAWMLIRNFVNAPRKIDPELFIRVMVGQRLCPACTADLEGLPTDHADRVVCPKCGAAWDTKKT